MSRETDEKFYARREREHLILAMSAPRPAIQDAHNKLAKLHREKLSEVLKRDSISVGRIVH